MTRRLQLLDRKRFDELYDKAIIGAGFFESDDYYRLERERYWQSLAMFAKLPLKSAANILEIGGGQLAVLCTKLFGDNCVVGDISDEFRQPLDRQSVPLIACNLLASDFPDAREQYDAVVLLEVIEHLPVPPYVIFEKLKRFLAPGGLLFITTPNLFRLRNQVRMLLGREFLDRFMLPLPGQGLGHQLEYSAEHLRWQIEQASLEVTKLDHAELGHKGHSTSAQVGRMLLSPLTLIPRWRDELVAVARKL